MAPRGALEPERIERPRLPTWIPRLIVVLLIVLVLPLHLYLDGRYPEPYPSLYMPRFTGVPIDGDLVTYIAPQILVTFASGDRREFSSQELLDLPVSEITVLSSMFSRGLDAEGEPDAPRPTGTWRRVLLPGAGGWSVDAASTRAHDPRTRAWLRERLSVLAPAENPVEMIVRWRRLEVTLDGAPVQTGQEVLRTVRISL